MDGGRSKRYASTNTMLDDNSFVFVLLEDVGRIQYNGKQSICTVAVGSYGSSQFEETTRIWSIASDFHVMGVKFVS